MQTSAEVPIGRWGHAVAGPPDDIGLRVLVERTDGPACTPRLGEAKPPFRVTPRTSGRPDPYAWLDGASVEEMVGVPGRVFGRYTVNWGA